MVDFQNLLPIGSVIRLTGATKSIMIFGIRQWNPEKNREYDYIGVLYPEGNLGGETQIMFNHEDIEHVAFRGYETPEREAFIQKLAAFYAAAEENQ